MRIRVEWDGADVVMGLRIRDKQGSKCIVIQSDATYTRWSIYRSADGFFTQPMTLAGIVNKLNDDEYTPESLH